MKDFNCFCIQNNIKYFLTGGTLLGAERHKGFIPWDDDVDIGMSRKDFIKFEELYKKNKEMNSKYFLQTFFTDENFVRPHAKLILKGTKIYTSNNNRILKSGISISLFIFDKIPNNKFIRKIHYLRVKNLIRIITYKQRKKEGIRFR